jgi:bacterioferritin-associated ferredoxin
MPLTDIGEEQLADLIAALPPAPEAWVRAAQELPAARAEMDDPNMRTKHQEEAMPHTPTTHDLDTITGSLDNLLGVLTGSGAEVQSHALSRRYVSDEQVKQAVEQVQSALALLREIETDPEVQSHALSRRYVSDERVKQAVEQVQNALALLRELDTDAEVESHALSRHMISDDRVKQAVEEVENALALLRQIAGEDE